MKKHTVIAVLMLFALALVVGARTPAGQAPTRRQEQAVVEFTRQVKLLNVFLKGEYLVVHDEEKMALGEPCTYIYNHGSWKPGELVVSFHCTPVQRNKVDRFTVLVSSRNNAFDVPEVRELQFAGSAEGHQVPTPYQ